MITKRCLVCIGVLLLPLWFAGCAAPAPDTPENRLETARQIARLGLEAGARDNMLNGGVAVALDYTVGALEEELQRDLAAEERERVAGILHSVLEEFLTVEAWEEGLATIFAGQFTNAELTAYLEFFRSPEGNKLLRMDEAVSGEIDAWAEGLLGGEFDAFGDRVDEELEKAFEGLVPGGNP